MCLVQEMQDRTKNALSEKDSKLFMHYHMSCSKQGSGHGAYYQADLKPIAPESINGRIFCIDPFPCNSPITMFRKTMKEHFELIVVKHRQKDWPEEFLKSGQRPSSSRAQSRDRVSDRKRRKKRRRS